MTRAARLAWSLFAATLALLAGQGYLVVASHTPLVSAADGLNTFPVITVGTALGALVGAVVAARHPANPVGWLFCVGPLGTALGLAAEAIGAAALERGSGASGSGAPGWLLEPAVVVGYCFGAVWALTYIAAIFLLVPEGRLPSRRWQPVAGSLTLPVLIAAPTLVTFAGTHELRADQDPRAVAWYFLAPLVCTWVLVALNMAAGALGLVLRMRRAHGVLRQQLRWLATAAAALAAGTVLEIAAPTSAGGWRWLYDLPLYLAYGGVPVAAGIAVLRYRLYDIDVIISRAALLAMLLVFVTTGYVAAVVGIGGPLGDRAGSSFTVSLVATAVVAAAFQPVRLWAVRLADRLAYGPRAAPYEALADLSRRLGESPDPGLLLPAIASAAATAVGASRAIAVLHGAAGTDASATWPQARADQPFRSAAVELPVVDRGETLGAILVELPTGQALQPGGRDLLGGLADQAGLALRNARLSAELADRVEQLRAHTLELVESRRRLVTAGDAERRRLERAIARDVVPHLDPLPGALDQLAGRLPADASALHAPLGAVTSALEGLREITRGVFPAQLVRGGLAPALTSYLGREDSRGRLDLHVSATSRRFDPRVEATAYFCVTEAAEALDTPFQVGLTAPNSHLELTVRGRRHGPLPMSNIRDRVEAAGGTVIERSADGQTQLDVRLPATAGRLGRPGGDQVRGGQGVEASQAAVSRSGPNADLVT